jgi:hypothetical protein
MIRSAFAFLLLPGVALAHGGAHLHPHGAETPVGVLLAALAVAVVVGVRMSRSGR